MLHSVFKSIRTEWCLTGNTTLSREQLFNDYLKEFPEEEITSDFTQEKRSEFESRLQDLQVASLIELQDNLVISKIPFDTIVNKFMPDLGLLDSLSVSPDTVKNLLHTHIKDAGNYVYDVLEREGIFSFTANGLFITPCAGQELIALTDIVLTQIENADSKQIQYGIYDTKVTGREILEKSTVSNDALKLRTEFALRRLKDDGYLLPIKITDDVCTWVFRSRIGEITRLVRHVKQRMRKEQEGKDLVRSLKLEVRDRKYPKRVVPIHDAVENLRMLAVDEHPDIKERIDKAARILEDALTDSGYTFVSEYQVRSFNTIFSNLLKGAYDASGFVLTAGTGMGKTLSYMVPLLFYCMILEYNDKGVKSLNIYPRIRLAENQLAQFAKLLSRINTSYPDKKIRIGIDYTGTPYTESSFSSAKVDKNKPTLHDNGINRLWKRHGDEGYIIPYMNCPHCGKPMLGVPYDVAKGAPLTCFDCKKTVDWVPYTKESQSENPPDILILTTEMLNRHLLEQNAQSLFGDQYFNPPRMIMVDEMHLHTSLQGSHISMLLRRLLQRIELTENGAPYVVGLSATIGKPKTFFKELTGIPEERIVHEEPQDHELEKQGAEYYLFVKPEIASGTAVISSLLQTAMCVLHNMPQMERNDKPERFKALGFVDSLDLVRRWQHDLDDAETHGKLYKFRDPLHQPYKQFTTKGSEIKLDCQQCKSQVNTACPAYQNGECWWFMRYGNKFQTQEEETPLTVTSLTAGEGEIQPKYDLMVTTSAMEVGYDDPDIMCVIQYQSPMNMASFSQRKGRAGRGLRNRPITLAVLSPYRTKDVFYYQNHHYLTDPSFEKPPLNAENLSILQIHGFFAELDKIAYDTHNNAESARSVNSVFPLSYKSEPRFRKNELSIIRNSVGGLSHSRKVLGNPSKQVMDSISEMFQEFIDELEITWGKQSNGKKILSIPQILPARIPVNFFTTLNLPAVNICDYYPKNDLAVRGWEYHRRSVGCSFDPEDTNQFLTLAEEKVCNTEVVSTVFTKPACADAKCQVNYLDKEVDINLGLSTTSPGKVTKRYKTDFWIPPITVDTEQTDVKKLDIEPYFLQTKEHQKDPMYHPEISARDIPKSLAGYLANEEISALSVYRPDFVRMKSFTNRDGETDWIYVPESGTICQGVESKEYKELGNPKYVILDASSVTFPQGFYSTNLDVSSINPDETYASILKSNYGDNLNQNLRFGPFSKVFSEMHFANAETKQYINATHTLIGSSGSLKDKNGKYNEEIRFGFCKKSDAFDTPYQDVALGYKLITDGIELRLDHAFIHDTVPNLAAEDKALYDDLLTYIFMSDLYRENRSPKGHNSFLLSAFLEAYLYVYRKFGYSSEMLAECAVNPTMKNKLVDVLTKRLEDIHESSSKSIDQVSDLLQSEGGRDFLLQVSRLQRDILELGDIPLVRKRITDIFVHSLKHALKSACITLGGFENERDVLGWVELSSDFENPESKICLFEQGMYGTGGFRTIFQKFKSSPLAIWNHIFSTIEFCPTHHEETQLLSLLSQEETVCEEISDRVSEILATTGTEMIEKKVQSFLSFIQTTCELYIDKGDLGQILRVFEPALEFDGQTFSNWRLYRELNTVIAKGLAGELGRTPTSVEIKDRCYELIVKGDTLLCPSWTSLAEFFKSNSMKNTSELKTRVFSEIDHRLLNTCVDGCPSCLQTNCTLDNNPKSKHLLLSRRLLELVLSKLKEDVSLSLDDEKAKNEEKVLEILSQQCLVYIQYSKEQLTSIARLVARSVGKSVTINGIKHRIYVHSDRYRSVDTVTKKPIYELCLALKEVGE